MASKSSPSNIDQAISAGDQNAPAPGTAPIQVVSPVAAYHPLLPGWSEQVSWRMAASGIVADWRDGFQRYGALHRPFVILFEQDCADETDNGVLVREDADHLGPPLDLAVETLDRVGGVELGAMGRREAHTGENVSLRFVEEAGGLGHFRRS